MEENLQRIIICYARVSTLDQHPENQFEDLKRKASELGTTHELLVEKESTRKTRPVKEDIMRRIRKGEVKAVIVWKLDRFARSSMELSISLEELKKNKTRFISLKDGIDLDPEHISPIQELQYNIMASFAQFERDLFKERSAAGRERAIKEGKHMGRPLDSKDKHPRKRVGYFGNQNKSKSKPTIDSEQSKNIENKPSMNKS